ncbi:MAG: hypothetical protein WA765_00765 [Candidatus Acidiferrum sp.]
MARTRTTKKLAQRIDLNYFKRPTGLKRAKFWLSVGLPALALVWIGWHGFSRDSSVYSSGRMSEAHAVLEAECAACHVKTAGTFTAQASDAACLSCHDGPMHHATQMKTLGCASCHTEHRGRVSIVGARNESCATCHGDLKTRDGTAHFVSEIYSFQDGHPEFAALRSRGGKPASDPGTINLNHAIHLKPVRRGPNGPNVQLECGDCHRPHTTQPAMEEDHASSGSTPTDWTYSDARYASAGPTYSAGEELLLPPAGTLRGYRLMTGQELMAPVKFATACAGCHSLAFDKRFNEGVPHDKPEVVHAFLMKKFSEYIDAHPAELRETRDPGRDLTGEPLRAAARVYTPKEWVAARISDAEELLWRKTCKQCHALTVGAQPDRLPVVEPARTTVRWMPHAKFDHDAHRGFACVSCHEKALSSTEASDVLLPGIATCKACHAPGPEHAESRCFECHTYHDWSKRKEIKATFLLPALRNDGR